MSGNDMGSKPWWQSRTIIGALVTLAALAAGFFKLKIDVANASEIAVQLVGLVGTALVIYGRIKATKPIVFTGTKAGGAFNPAAEVRRAEQAGRGGLRKGYFRLPALVAAGVWIAVVLWAALFIFWVTAKASTESEDSPAAAHISGLEERALPHNLSGPWLRTVAVEDHRPFLVRLWESITGSIAAEMIITEKGHRQIRVREATIKGGTEW